MDGVAVVTAATLIASFNQHADLPLTLTAEEQDDVFTTVRLLSAKLLNQQARLRALDAYYAGNQPISFISREVREQVGSRLTSLVINWPRIIVDSVQRRCYVEGFRVGDGGQADEDLWRIWQANDLDEWSQLGEGDSLVHGRSFLSVWGNDDDPETPRIATESAHEMVVGYKAGTRDVAAALKRWADGKSQEATLYQPTRIVRLRSNSRSGGSNIKWEVIEVLDNPLGAVPVVPLVNRPRLMDLDGESELADVIPLADAVNKLATDMMVASEYHASKRRYATGIEIPTGDGPRERLQAEVKKWWDEATQGKTWLAGPGVNFGEFTEATLDNFVNAIGMLTGQIAAIAGLPPHYLGVNTQNPASADAIRSAESTLVERAKEKHRIWGGAFERVMRFAIAARDGKTYANVSRELGGMETIWRDPETPTVASAADAAVKLLETGVYDIEFAQERVGLSPTQRQEIAERRLASAATAATAEVEARMALARRLQTEDGLSQNASLAAVGYVRAAATNAAGV